MYGPTCDTFLTSRLNEGIHQSEAIHLRLQVVVEHGLEGCHLRIHNHDIGCDSCLAEGDTLIGHSHSEIIHTLILQRLGYLHSTSAIGIGLDHAHHLGIGLQERAIVIQILHHRIEVHLEDGFMHFLLQLLRNLIETKGTSTL